MARQGRDSGCAVACKNAVVRTQLAEIAVPSGTRTIRFCVALVPMLAAALIAFAAQADSAGESTICRGRYALCSSAQCRPLRGDKDHAVCRCEGPLRGPNIGDSPCAAREATITSTFSLADLISRHGHAAKTPLHCAGSDMNRWASCLDAPCTGIKGGVACKCKLQPISAFTVFSAGCLSDPDKVHALCAKIWSSASDNEFENLYRQLRPLHSDAPKLGFCPLATKP